MTSAKKGEHIRRTLECFCRLATADTRWIPRKDMSITLRL